MSIKNKSTFSNMILTLTIIALLMGFMLSFVEQLTKEPIQRSKDELELEAISSVVKEFDNDPFSERLSISTKDEKHKLDFYPARKNGVVNSYAIKTFTNNGYGGKIEMIVGFFVDGRVNSFMVTNSKETPGLGSKIDEEKFKAQFKGFHPKEPSFKLRKDGGEIDAITAATISSRATLDAIIRASDAYEKFSGGL